MVLWAGSQIIGCTEKIAVARWNIGMLARPGATHIRIAAVGVNFEIHSLAPIFRIIGGGGFIVAFPDVCKTPAPAGPVPIPYPNIAQTAKAKQQAKKVKVQKKGAVGRSMGDEAGTLKGTVSSKNAEVMAIKTRLNSLNTTIQRLSPDQPDKWQTALQDYAVAASALYTTLNPE